MTNKEKIIINEIDVTECTYRRQKPHNFCMCASVINESGNLIELTRYVQCEYNPNCNFKQLKRKEQECKELNSLTDEYKQALDKIEKIISEEVISWDEVDRMTAQIINIINKVKEQ